VADNRVIARSASDEAIQIPAQAAWIASLALAMTRNRHRSRDAHAPELCPPPRTEKDSPPAKREAKRRKAHVPTISAQQRQTSPFADASARLRATLGGAPAFRRFTAALTTGYYPDGSAPEPGFRKVRRAGVLPVRRPRSLR
jgi:hypothetical protein